jgi:hypothetical protein
MDKKLWDTLPCTTNVAETAHAARNAETSINASLLMAINEYLYSFF